MALTLARKKLVQACLVNSSSFGFISTSTIQTPVLVNNGFGRSLVLDGLRTSREVLLRKLELTLKNHKVDEAWETFNDLKRLHGFPECSIVNKFVTELSYSSESHWLKKACILVLIILKEKPNLLQLDVLAKLSLSLARAQMPIPASMILRLMLEKKNLPAMNILWWFFCICAEKSNCAKLIKPYTMIFNLVMDACIHDMNSQRDELKKFKDYIDRVSVPFLQHSRQFYDSLLSLYFKFDDIDAASELVLDMNRYRDSLPDQKLMKGSQKPCLVPIGSPNLRNGLKIQIMPELLEKDSILKIEGKQELILFRNGKLLLGNRALAKLINGYKRYGKISGLSKLLLSIQKENNSLEEFALCSDVIDAFIQSGLQETAHDILDDMESAGYPMRSTTYMSLLRAYYKLKMSREAVALLKQMKKVGLALNLSDEMGISSTKPSVGKMIDDALKIYRRMQAMNIQPTVHTFAYLAYGNMATDNLAANRDLFEIMLLNFLKGGYFERMMEVINYMKEHSMYIDKCMYKSEFLKHHKNLYQSLKASNVRTEAQSKRLEHVKAFRKLVDID
ncbi:hypothetical protein Patl1_23989 [Pistacia atlantica]|uniref:Uncharacterized protein n=1 Tax=Pistacia atlantica TaxID=434234 RepID=A0ACC0ZZQ6_9ROSI|nr:hypothetical protein Patl1_23989 [Pistacia atlantica]